MAITATITQVKPGWFRAEITEPALTITSRYPETDFCHKLAELGYGHEMLVTLRDGVPALRMSIGAWSDKIIEERGDYLSGFLIQKRPQSIGESPQARETGFPGTSCPKPPKAPPETILLLTRPLHLMVWGLLRNKQ